MRLDNSGIEEEVPSASGSQSVIPYSLRWHLHGVKAMVDKTAGTLAEIKSVVPNCTGNHWGCLLPWTYGKTLQSPVSLKHVLDEEVKTILFYLHHWIYIYLLYILYDEMQNTHQVFLLHTKVQWLSSRKALTPGCFSSKLI